MLEQVALELVAMEVQVAKVEMEAWEAKVEMAELANQKPKPHTTKCKTHLAHSMYHHH
jgi:hypothetical protein